jgi:hypothetical protein
MVASRSASSISIIPTAVTHSTNDTLFKIEHGGNFWRGALTEAGWQQWPAVPQRTREGAPKIKPGSPVETEARPHATRIQSKAAGKSARSAQAGSKAARHRF